MVLRSAASTTASTAAELRGGEEVPRSGERVILPGGREAFLGAITGDLVRVYPLDDGESIQVTLADLTRRPPAGQPEGPQIGCAVFCGPRLIGHITGIDGEEITIQRPGGGTITHCYVPGELRQSWILTESAD